MTPFDLAQRFIGIQEIGGDDDHPLIQWWLSLCGFQTNVHDEIPWCSAFVNGICWELRIPRSKSAAARSWLTVGRPIAKSDLRAGFDVVVLKRGQGEQPGPEVINAPGHVGFYAGDEMGKILVLGGNQRDGVNVSAFALESFLGGRRLFTPPPIALGGK